MKNTPNYVVLRVLSQKKVFNFLNRATQVLDPINSHRIAQILAVICNASRCHSFPIGVWDCSDCVHWPRYTETMTMTMTMTMTHSEKSHIHRMKAWPYRQECRGHDPTKRNLFCWCSLLVGKVCRYKLLEDRLHRNGT